MNIDLKPFIIITIILAIVGTAQILVSRPRSVEKGTESAEVASKTTKDEVAPLEKSNNPTLSVGENAQVVDLNIKVNSIKNIGADSVSVGVTLSEGGKFRNSTLVLGDKPLEYHDYKVSVVNTTPKPDGKTTDYAVTFDVVPPNKEL